MQLRDIDLCVEKMQIWREPVTSILNCSAKHRLPTTAHVTARQVPGNISQIVALPVYEITSDRAGAAHHVCGVTEAGIRSQMMTSAQVTTVDAQHERICTAHTSPGASGDNSSRAGGYAFIHAFDIRG